MKEKKARDAEQLWDEILKAIVERMPKQILPLIQDVFGITYPDDVTITLLPTETTLPQDEDFRKLTSIYSDIALKIENDLYHLECQINNDSNMSIRMIKYDFHLGLSARILFDSEENTIVFPKSVVIYPSPDDNIPDELVCHLLFPDGSRHDYKVPTLRIQQYDLEEIQQKHLTLFLPYKLLQFRPRLKSKINPITETELTDFINDIILILRDELESGRLTQFEYEDYIELIDKSAKRVFKSHKILREQVINMTKSLITLPSERYEKYEKQLAEKDAALLQKDAALSQKDCEIAELKRQLEVALAKNK